MRAAEAVACLHCDLLQRRVTPPLHGVALCARCGAVLYRRPGGGLDAALACTLGAAILFVAANALPLAELSLRGQQASATLFGLAVAMASGGEAPVAALVLLVTLVVPALHIALLLATLVPLRLGRSSSVARWSLRRASALRTWAMLDVLLLGLLASIVKLSAVAALAPGGALWALAATVMLRTAAAASVDSADLWARLEPGR